MQSKAAEISRLTSSATDPASLILCRSSYTGIYLNCCTTSETLCNSFDIFQNQRSSGGTLTSYNQINACERFCVSLPNCFAFDFDWASSQCSWFNNPAQVASRYEETGTN